MRLDARKILITGGGSGIGLALARALAADNQVVVAGRDPAKLERAVAGDPRLRAVPLDVISEENSRAAVALVVRQLGGIDILINSAGVMRPTPLESEAATQTVEEEVGGEPSGIAAHGAAGAAVSAQLGRRSSRLHLVCPRAHGRPRTDVVCCDEGGDPFGSPLAPG